MLGELGVDVSGGYTVPAGKTMAQAMLQGKRTVLAAAGNGGHSGAAGPEVWALANAVRCIA